MEQKFRRHRTALPPSVVFRVWIRFFTIFYRKGFVQNITMVLALAHRLLGDVSLIRSKLWDAKPDTYEALLDEFESLLKINSEALCKLRERP